MAIIIPCCNEAESLPALVASLQRLQAALEARFRTQLIFVDDGSQDSTHELLQQIYAGRQDVTIAKHSANRGIAAAIATGCGCTDAETIASLDADCTYEPVETILRLVDRLTDEVAMVVASPYHPCGEVVGVPRWRLALSKAASRCYRLLLRNKLHTYTSCVRVYRRSAVATLPATQGGFVGIVELLWLVDRRGGKIEEAPAVLRVRAYGQSKMRLLRTIVDHALLLTRAAMRRVLDLGSKQHEPSPTYHLLTFNARKS